MLLTIPDSWRITGQVDGPFWGQWLGAPAWLTQHIGYRYWHTGDREFLAEYYPVLRDAARFYVSILREHPEYGWLVVVPSNSPENDFLHRDDGVEARSEERRVGKEWRSRWVGPA